MKILLIGGGGHAAMVLDAMRASGVEPMGIIERERSSPLGNLLGAPIVGTDEDLPALVAQGATHFVVSLGSVAIASRRKALFSAALQMGLEPWTVIHPTAWISPSAVVGPGTVVGARVVVNAQAKVGSNVILNTASVVEHDCVIGEDVHLAPGAVVAASVTVQAGAHIGAGATIRQGVVIGAKAVVAMGAAVVSDVADGSTVMGVPARIRQ